MLASTNACTSQGCLHVWRRALLGHNAYLEFLLVEIPLSFNYDACVFLLLADPSICIPACCIYTRLNVYCICSRKVTHGLSLRVLVVLEQRQQ